MGHGTVRTVYFQVRFQLPRDSTAHFLFKMFALFGSPITFNGFFMFKESFIALTSALLAVAVNATTGTCGKVEQHWE